MQATDIVRRRRERARRVNRPGRRLVRAAAVTVLTLLAVSLLAPFLAVAGGAAMLLSVVSDLPDITTLVTLPTRHQATTVTTQLFAWSAPDADGLRHPVVIDEIVDPRAGGAGWARLNELPDAVSGAFLAAADPQFLTAAPPSPLSTWAEWWETGVINDSHSPIIRQLILTHLRDGVSAQPDDTRRAIQDWLLGQQMERGFSREQMLEWTINSRYYGHLAYGIEAAARVYFDKGAADLTPGEAAMLAALSGNPSANPFDDPAGAQRSRDAILSAMAVMGVISAAEETAAQEVPIATAMPPGSESAAPEFARLARRELETILGPERLLAGGWQVEATLDLTLQDQANCVAEAHLSGSAGHAVAPGGDWSPCPAAGYLAGMADDATSSAGSDFAIVVLDPSTGEIEALAGDATAHSPRPVGGLVRPFIYLTVLSQGYTAASLMMDVQSIYLQDGRVYSPRNADGRYLGPLRLREALATDRAVTAAQALSWVGVDLVQETARALGLQPVVESVQTDLTFADRGFEATLLDLGRAFATVSNGGTTAGASFDDLLPQSVTVRRIMDAEGREVYAYVPVMRETLAPELAYLLTDMLADRETRCLLLDCADFLELPDGRRAAVATGESDTGDAWTVGYTPERVIGIRVSEEATATAAPLWRALMAWASSGEEPADWPRPVTLQPVQVCEASGLLPSPELGCPTVREWFAPGTEPVAFDSMTREVAINRETGRLATIFTPPQLVERRAYIVYPPEAAAWAAEAGIESPPVEYDSIEGVSTQAGGAAVLSPEPFAVVSGQGPVVGSAGGDDFAYYRLAVFPGLMPEGMENLVERGESPVDAAELVVWDTTMLDDGLYTLLLTVVRGDGTFDEVAVPVTIANE